MSTDLMSVKDLATYLKLHPQTIRRRVHDGTLPSQMAGRRIVFSRTMIDRWLRLKSRRWTPEEHEAFRKRMQEWARGRDITEEDILEAVRAVRYGDR